MAWWWDLIGLIPGIFLVWGIFRSKMQLPLRRALALRLGTSVQLDPTAGVFGAVVAMGVVAVSGCVWMMVSQGGLDLRDLVRGVGRQFPVVLLAGLLAAVVPVRRVGQLALYSSAPVTVWFVLVSSGLLSPYSGAGQ